MPGTVHVFDLLSSALEHPTGVVPVFGGERFLKKLAVDFLVRRIGGDDDDFSATQYDSESASWADVHDELATRSLFGGSGPRIVVVDHADKFVKENRDRIENYAEASSASGFSDRRYLAQQHTAL